MASSTSVMERIHIDDLASPALDEGQKALIAACPPVDLDEEKILEQARRETGLDDFGPEDFRERLRAWLEGFGKDRTLNAFGRFRCWQECVRYAANRLCLIDLEKRHPEVKDIAIDQPIIVIGMPRSGTSNLVNILAADRRLRSMPLWESIEPIPRPNEQAGAPDQRRARCIRDWGAGTSLLPYMDAMHESGPDYVHEDMDLMGADFSNYYPEWFVHVPQWRDYLLARDQTPHYAFSKRMLRAMSWFKGPNRWVLKSPSHMENLQAIATVYPDATTVMLHRDPIAVIQSIITMNTYVDRLRRSPVDMQCTADYWFDRVERMLRACVAQRAALPASQTIDVMFHEYMADPMGLVRRIYALADLPFTAEARQDAEGFITANPRGKHGQVVYDPIGDFGVDIAAMRERFQFYYDRFPVRIERVIGEKA